MATRLKDRDVVVIGLGAVGGVAVLPLAQAGLDVVGLEAGTWLTKKDMAPDEIRFNIRNWPMAVHKADGEVPSSRATASAQAFRGGRHPMMNAVGGTALHYWAQSWRLNPWDFKVVSETRRRYGASRIPKGSTVEDWPFGYEELEPYYDKVEWEMGVSGNAGNIQGKIDQAATSSRGRASATTRCRRCAAPPFSKKCATPPGRSAGTRFPVRPRSTRAPIRIAPAACITASATRAAVTWTPRIART